MTNHDFLRNDEPEAAAKGRPIVRVLTISQVRPEMNRTDTARCENSYSADLAAMKKLCKNFQGAIPCRTFCTVLCKSSANIFLFSSCVEKPGFHDRDPPFSPDPIHERGCLRVHRFQPPTSPGHRRVSMPTLADVVHDRASYHLEKAQEAIRLCPPGLLPNLSRRSKFDPEKGIIWRHLGGGRNGYHSWNRQARCLSPLPHGEGPGFRYPVSRQRVSPVAREVPTA